MNTPDDHPIALPPVMLSEADRDRLYAMAISALTNSRMASSASNVLREISRARIVPDDELPENVVAVNSHVDVRDNVTGTTRQVVLVMPHETSEQPNAVSVLSPLGAALIGLSEGHSVDWCSASGEPSSVTVLRSTASSEKSPARADRHVSRGQSRS
ncbi:GreA/GreB family elongation factor [Bradyrhizobium sp. A11]|uniref:GreA/GreB family elongation factor n=1 Tax=Bradyrhizobium sp. A11 TaxID=3133974 RepID=UPI0032460825